jgi:transcriptional regulator with XRE-family HTH domain
MLLSTVAFLRHLYASISGMSPGQCRKARALLDWTPADLARAAGVSVITVRNYEAGKVARGRFAPTLMRQALEGAGIRFSAGEDGPVKLDNRTR